MRSEEWRCGAQIRKRRKFEKSARVCLLPHYRERLYGKRFSVVGKQLGAFTHFKTRAAFPFDAAHRHSSLLTPHSSLLTPNFSELRSIPYPLHDH